MTLVGLVQVGPSSAATAAAGSSVRSRVVLEFSRAFFGE